MNSVKYDVMLILGSSLNADGSVSGDDEVRLERTVQIYGDLNMPIILCGSHGYKSTDKAEVSEAEAYAQYLIKRGIPKDALLLETTSQESLGNILFAKTGILMKHNWRRLLVIPTRNHSTDRIAYLLKKILGHEYTWNILRVGENNTPENIAREQKALHYTREINDVFEDGDHEAIYKGLKETHPAYGGTKWTVEELREELKH